MSAYTKRKTQRRFRLKAIHTSVHSPSHLALDGMIRRIDDPFWKTHSPPNGYRCRCSIRSLSEHQAKARSGQGKGLNQQPVLDDGTPALPDKGWDYNPSDRLAGVNKALVDKRGKSSDVLFSALSEKLSQEMKIITVDGFDVVQKQFSILARNNPDLFNNEIPLIHAVSNEAFFAATDGKDIYISVSDIVEKKFSPAIELVSAFNKSLTGNRLTFNQEYSIEILQHEIWHLVTHKTNMPTKNKGIVGETLVQLLARFTYPKLLERLGTKAIHQNSIISGGYGYSYQVSNLLSLLKMTGIDKDKFVKFLETAMVKNKKGDDMITDVARFIMSEGDRLLSYDRTNDLLGLLKSKDGFDKKAANKLNY